MPIIYTDKMNKLPKRIDKDVYVTPEKVAKAAIDKLISTEIGFFAPFFSKRSKRPMYVLDPGCGDGVWGNQVRGVFYKEIITGYDIRNTNPENYDYFYNDDFITVDKFIYGYDLVVGNPPYSFVHEFIKTGYNLLRQDGFLLYLLKLSILEGQKRFEEFYSGTYQPKYVWVNVNRVPFTGNSNPDSTCIVVWQKEWSGRTQLDWLDWKNKK